MSRFRKVAAGTWGDERFRSLSEPAQRLWFYLLTGPEVTSLPGLIVVGRAGLAEALGWSPSKLDRCFAELERATNEEGVPMAKADWRARLVWLPKGYRHNVPHNTNVILGWKELWRAVPECALKHEALIVLREFVATLGESFVTAFESAVDRYVAVRRRDQPQERAIAGGSKDNEAPMVDAVVSPSTSTSTAHPPTRACARAPAAPAPVTASSLFPEGVQGESSPRRRSPADEVFEHYLAVRKRHRPKTRGGVLEPKDRRATEQRLKAGYTVEDLKRGCEGLFLSPHHLGDNDRHTEYLAFRYILRDNNLDAFIALAEAAERRRRGAGISSPQAPAEPSEPPLSAAELKAEMDRFREGAVPEMFREVLGEGAKA